MALEGQFGDDRGSVVGVRGSVSLVALEGQCGGVRGSFGGVRGSVWCC